MTREFNVYHHCPKCGESFPAETDFGHWMRKNKLLDSCQGIVRTDTDHTIVCYKVHKQGRKFQLIMDLETKEFGAKPTICQQDIISFKTQLALSKGKNLNGATTYTTHKLRSELQQCRINARYYGFHVLQFEKTSPDNSEWIKWDYKPISSLTLTDLLRFERHPFYPDRSLMQFLRDRHQQPKLRMFNF
jgi:hypothetical protein